MEVNKIYCENCIDTMSKMPDGFVDVTVTSPPYDGLRTYNGYSFPFKDIAKELFRVTKEGGVVVWVVGDATVKGSETGTSFKQALYFKEIGFNLHDTMIWKKTNPTPVDPRIHRYTESFEYMFIFSKNKINKNGVLCRIECKTAGNIRGYTEHSSQLKKDGTKRTDRADKRLGKATKKTKILDNVWINPLPNNKTGHPAVFPEQLANDHIISWSNEGDLVYDPFMGSGTTAKMAILNGRNYIGSEMSKEYCEIAEKRINEISVEDMQKIVDANEKLVKELEDAKD